MRPQDTAIPNITTDLQRSVQVALAEDIGSGDITAQLIPEDRTARARVITREDCTLSGRAWVEAVFHAMDPELLLTWHFEDGDRRQASGFPSFQERDLPPLARRAARSSTARSIVRLSGSSSFGSEALVRPCLT